MMESPQYSKEWYIRRCGKFNGSEISKLMEKGRAKDAIFGKTAISYIIKVASERKLNMELLQNDEIWDQYFNLTNATSKEMQWGHDLEATAIEYYLRHYIEDDEEPKLVSLDSIPHPTIPTIAASADGMLVHADGTKSLIEAKSPLPKTFYQYKVQISTQDDLKSVKPEYYWQTQAELICNPDAEYLDWIVFCPFMVDKLHVVRITRNGDDIKELESRVLEAEKMIKEFE